MILDTNVVSETLKLRGDERVLTWFNDQDESLLYLTAVSVAELWVGVRVLPEGRRKETLEVGVKKLLGEFVTPVLPFDDKAALAYAAAISRARSGLYTLPIFDGMIAAIAAVHGYTVATRDVEPFVAAGVKVVNPWEFSG